MPSQDMEETDDRDEVCRRRFDKIQRDYLRTLVTPEVIEEHRRSPLGQHSEPLERLLIYFRRQPRLNQYVIMTVEPFQAYKVVLLSDDRNGPPRNVDDRIHASPADAHHGVFLRRLQDLLES